MKIAVAGLGYVGMSLAVLLSQHDEVCALDISQERVDLVNNKKSPIADTEIERYLAEKQLNLSATTSNEEAFNGADYIVVATPTDYDPIKNYFDTSTVEKVIKQAQQIAPDATVVIKSTIPVGFTENLHQQGHKRILFSPEFLREGQALYDNLYPSRIIVGIVDDSLQSKAEEFASLLKQSALSDNVPVLITGATEAEAVKLLGVC